MVKITSYETEKLKRLFCPCCHERVPRVGIIEGSKIDGLTFECKKCRRKFLVKTE